jgi:hypothetical protein
MSVHQRNRGPAGNGKRHDRRAGCEKRRRRDRRTIVRAAHAVNWRAKVPSFSNQQSHPFQEDRLPTALHADSPRLAALALDDYRELGALDLQLNHAAPNRGAVNE